MAQSTGGLTVTDAGPQYVQGGIFGGLDFQPLGWDAPTGSTPATSIANENSATNSAFGFNPPSLPSFDYLTGQGAGGSAAASQGIATTAAPSSTTGSVSNAPANNWFVRAVIVILGFIFVAVGLSQFGVVQRGIRP